SHDGEPFDAEAVRVTVQRVSYFKCYLGKQFEDAYLLGLSGPMHDAELDNLVSSKGRGLYGKNERVDQLFDLGRATLEPAKRRAEDGPGLASLEVPADLGGQGQAWVGEDVGGEHGPPLAHREPEDARVGRLDAGGVDCIRRALRVRHRDRPVDVRRQRQERRD